MACVVGAGAALAQPIDHAALGAQAFADGKLDEALRELEAAYRDEPDPNLLFALGRVHSARGDCVRAVDHYRRYLDTQPGQRGADAAEAEIDKCQRAAAVALRPPVGGRTDRSAQQDPPVVASQAPAPRGFASTMVHDHFVQVGLITGVLAGGVYVYALRTACWDGECAVGEDVDYDDFKRRYDLAPKLGAASAVMGGVAAGLVLTGVVRYAMRDDDETRFTASLAPAPGGGAIVVSGQF